MAAARLEQEKGFDIGIKAMKKIIEKYPDYKLRIYGDGDFEKLYGQLIDDLKIRPYIEYMGLSSHIIEDIHDVMVFLLPSRSEGIPNMLLESMAAGIPCVAADCPPGGPRMLLENDKNGLLVPVENVDATADAVCELIGNTELRNSVAENATKVTERFKPEKIEEMWRQCFITIMDGNN
jgi:glycosyltransferase involved in cell wall biosynthesis